LQAIGIVEIHNPPTVLTGKPKGVGLVGQNKDKRDDLRVAAIHIARAGAGA
jgi:hypothetical protein